MTDKRKWSAAAKSGLIQFPDKTKPKIPTEKSWPPLETQTVNKRKIVKLAKNELNGPQISKKLGLSYTYVIKSLNSAGSLVWLDHAELVNLRESRNKKNK
jgi:hypothetical protein